MATHVYGVSEIVGTSPDGVDEAIEVGIARASTTLRGLDWFEVTQVSGPHPGWARCSLPGQYEGRFPLGRLNRRRWAEPQRPTGRAQPRSPSAWNEHLGSQPIPRPSALRGWFTCRRQ